MDTCVHGGDGCDGRTFPPLAPAGHGAYTHQMMQACIADVCRSRDDAARKEDCREEGAGANGWLEVGLAHSDTQDQEVEKVEAASVEWKRSPVSFMFL